MDDFKFSEIRLPTPYQMRRYIDMARRDDDQGHRCVSSDCDRSFLSKDAMLDHAESVHTFNDIERIVSEHVRETYSKPSTRDQAGTYSWVSDIADDWVVFTVEKPNDISLFKSTYTLVDEKVTLGDPVEVRRRTVYDPVKKENK